MTYKRGRAHVPISAIPGDNPERTYSDERVNRVDVDAGNALSPNGLEDVMIMLCERCCAQITESEPVVRLAHIDHARRDGTLVWRHSFVHSGGCAAPRPAEHERPDTGTWDPARGIGGLR